MTQVTETKKVFIFVLKNAYGDKPEVLRGDGIATAEATRQVPAFEEEKERTWVLGLPDWYKHPLREYIPLRFMVSKTSLVWGGHGPHLSSVFIGVDEAATLAALKAEVTSVMTSLRKRQAQLGELLHTL